MRVPWARKPWPVVEFSPKMPPPAVELRFPAIFGRASSSGTRESSSASLQTQDQPGQPEEQEADQQADPDRQRNRQDPPRRTIERPAIGAEQAADPAIVGACGHAEPADKR